MKSGLLLAVGDFPEGNATASRLRMLSRTLAAGGFDITVGLIHATLREAEENQSTAGHLGPVRFVYFNGRVTRPHGAWAAARDTLTGMLAAKKFVKRRVREEGLDFIVLYTPNGLKIGPALRLARSHDIPLFLEACEIRSLTTGATGHPPLRRRLANTLDRRLETSAHHLTRGVIAISSGIAAHYAALGVADRDILLLPILVDTELYRHPSFAVVEALRGRRFFFNSGSYAEKDGVGHLVRAFGAVTRLHADLWLAFSGQPDAVTRRRLLAGLDMAVAERIVFTGYLERDELVWCYQNAAGLLSCRSDSDYANLGFPTKLAEYLASGTPVIATDVGDVCRYLTDGDSVFLALPEDVDSIAAAMSRVLTDAALAAKIARSGQEVASAFDYRRYVRPLADFVNRRTGDRHS